MPSTVDHVNGINNGGQIASETFTSAYPAFGINNLGQTVGVALNGDIEVRSGGSTTDIGKPATLDVAGPTAINDRGQVVGYGTGSTSYGPHTGPPQPFIYSDGHFTVLPMPFTTANAINASGQVVGGEMNNSASPFLYQNGRVTDLGSLGGGPGIAQCHQ